jgi:DNA-binding NarL/FixJ family response regulator
MRIRVAVADPVPLFRVGVMAILREAGFQSEVPDDLLEWSHQAQSLAVMLTLQSAEDWKTLREMRRVSPELIVVAFLVDDDVPTWVRAITTGAATVLARDAPAGFVRSVFQEAVQGRCVLPVEVVRALVAERATPAEPASVSEQEIAWLRELANGSTVAQVAAGAGYSERAMFRLLRGLYARMDVSSRTEALIKANREGWL